MSSHDYAHYVHYYLNGHGHNGGSGDDDSSSDSEYSYPPSPASTVDLAEGAQELDSDGDDSAPPSPSAPPAPMEYEPWEVSDPPPDWPSPLDHLLALETSITEMRLERERAAARLAAVVRASSSSSSSSSVTRLSALSSYSSESGGEEGELLWDEEEVFVLDSDGEEEEEDKDESEVEAEEVDQVEREMSSLRLRNSAATPPFDEGVSDKAGGGSDDKADRTEGEGNSSENETPAKVKKMHHGGPRNHAVDVRGPA